MDKSVAEIKARNIFKDVKYEVVDGSEKNLKVIDIFVEEKPTGEISAGAGIGTNGGSFAFNIKESNWLGKGQVLNFEFEVDSESVSGALIFSDPNYNFLEILLIIQFQMKKMISLIKATKIRLHHLVLERLLSNIKTLELI